MAGEVKIGVWDDGAFLENSARYSEVERMVQSI